MPRKSSAGAHTTPKTRSLRMPQGDSARPAAARWEVRLAAARGPEQVYSMTATYRIGDIVLHEQFGKGVVLKLSTRKCTVLFQDKERVMASAN